MNHKTHLKNILLATLFFGLLFLLNHFNRLYKKPFLNLSKENTALNFNENFLKLATLGFNRMTSSILWIETLLESDLEHYGQKDLNSWMFLRFNTIRILDPAFFENYYYGAQYLSIIKNDKEGAKVLYQEGLKKFPDNFWLNFQAAFHFYFELGDLESALPLYSKIQFSALAGQYAPYLPSLTAKLMVKNNHFDGAFDVLLTAFKQTHRESPLYNKFHESLYALTAEKDLDCLNSKSNSECSRLDFDQNPYVNIDGKYFAQKKWKPFRIKKTPSQAGGQ